MVLFFVMIVQKKIAWLSVLVCLTERSVAVVLAGIPERDPELCLEPEAREHAAGPNPHIGRY